MNKKIKKVLIWGVTVVLIIAASYGYGFSKVEEIWIWELERAVIFGFGLLYLVCFARLLMGMFKR